jgi:small-conductance mechanosensitive channel
VAVVSVAVPAVATDDGLVAACGSADQRTWLCATVHRVTGSRDAAEVADVLARPLRIGLVVLLAMAAVWLARRIVTRVVHKVSDSDRMDALRRRAGMAQLTVTERARRRQRADTVADVLRNVVAIAVWVIAVLVVIGELGIDLAPLLAGAGVITLVLGFGAQTVVRDYLAGLFIVLEDQYGVGDVIEVAEVTGTVELITLRATRFRDVEGVVWWVPNGEIKRVGNKSQQWSRALLDVTVAPDSDLVLVTEVIQRTADEMWGEERWRASLLDEPEVWGVEDVGGSGVVVRLVVKTLPHAQWQVARELRARLKRAFDDAGIAMAPS